MATGNTFAALELGPDSIASPLGPNDDPSSSPGTARLPATAASATAGDDASHAAPAGSGAAVNGSVSPSLGTDETDSQVHVLLWSCDILILRPPLLACPRSHLQMLASYMWSTLLHAQWSKPKGKSNRGKKSRSDSLNPLQAFHHYASHGLPPAETAQEIVARHNFYMFSFRTELCPDFPAYKCDKSKPYICTLAHYDNHLRRKPVVGHVPPADPPAACKPMHGIVYLLHR